MDNTELPFLHKILPLLAEGETQRSLWSAVFRRSSPPASINRHVLKTATPSRPLTAL